MADDAATTAVEIGNYFIKLANEKLQQGQRPDLLASAMRNAAANFTGFAETLGRGTVDVDAIVEEFRQMLEYYAQLHRQQMRPVTGLERLVEQVKKE